ncbi:MAG: signal recognition particle-docking protein FtsY [Thermoproteota archaeon]|nr:signal recognition particle-docking protein FtsY [Thermoproteota archaeon]
MFDKLKKAFSRAAKGIAQKELTEKILDDVLLDLQIALLESDVAQEVVDDISAKLKRDLLGLKLEKEQDATKVVQSKLQAALAEIFARTNRFDLLERIKTKKEAKGGPFVIVFLGINGTGKTTTVAKMANLLRKAGFSLVVAAGDTHRAGAIEQLEQHMNRLSLKLVKQRYGADPSSVGRDAYDHAKKNHLDIVLLDTAGRMQTSKNLMDEMGKIVRVVKPDVKLFIGDALAGNDTINQAREFFQYTNFDGAILTKVDADAKGGSAISVAHITSRPIIYIGVGQGYDDIVPFDSNKFIESLFEGSGQATVTVEEMRSIQKVSEPEMQMPRLEEEAPGIKEENVEKDILLLSKPSASAKPLGGIQTSPVQEDQQQKDSRKIAPEPTLDNYTDRSVKKEEKEEEQDLPKQKKSRFGFFGRNKKEGDQGKKQRDKNENKQLEEPRRSEMAEDDGGREDDEDRIKQEDARTDDKEDNVQQKKGTKEVEEEKVIYLTDEDIEDLLK